MSDRLIAMANEAGGGDNTTVVVVALRDDLHAGVSATTSRPARQTPRERRRHLELTQETLTIGLKVDNIPSRSKILPSRGIMHGL